MLQVNIVNLIVALLDTGRSLHFARLSFKMYDHKTEPQVASCAVNTGVMNNIVIG